MATTHWLEYRHFLRRDSTKARYEQAQPDTAVWEKLGFNDAYLSHYLLYRKPQAWLCTVYIEPRK